MTCLLETSSSDDAVLFCEWNGCAIATPLSIYRVHGGDFETDWDLLISRRQGVLAAQKIKNLARR
jgi:hypothetical protein